MQMTLLSCKLLNISKYGLRDSSDEKEEDEESIDVQGLANKKHDIFNVFYGENYRKKKAYRPPQRRYIGNMKMIEWQSD